MGANTLSGSDASIKFYCSVFARLELFRDRVRGLGASIYLMPISAEYELRTNIGGRFLRPEAVIFNVRFSRFASDSLIPISYNARNG